MDEERAFTKFQPIVRARARKDYGCVCAWCGYRAYELLQGKPDPGLPSNAIAVELMHQGAAAETMH